MTSNPQHRPLWYPVHMPFPLIAFNFCTDVTAPAQKVKLINKLWSTSRNMTFCGSLRESQGKAPLLMTGLWWYHRRKISSKQGVQRCINLPVAIREHNCVVGGKCLVLHSQTHSECTLSASETALPSRGSGHDSKCECCALSQIKVVGPIIINNRNCPKGAFFQ